MKRLLLFLCLLSTTAFAETLTWCSWVSTRLSPNYRSLLDRHPNPTYQDRAVVRAILRLGNSSCTSSDDERRAAYAFARVADAHSGRIGALLPLTGPEGEMGRALEVGLRAALPPGKLVVKDTSGQVTRAEDGLAELLFKDNVAAVVVGGSSVSIAPLVRWAGSLVVPMIVLSSEKVDIGTSKFVFRVFPRPQDMAEALAESARSHDWKRIAVLRPEDGHADRLILHLQSAAKRRGLTLTHQVDYKTGEFDSMDAAVRSLYEIDPKLRAPEYRRLVRLAKQKAEDAHVEYDARSVILKPHIDDDVTFIPDDFRIVRHFAKLMRFHGVKQMPLMGDTGWRSPGLVSPPEPFLDGSVFADFIGSYRNLPAGLAIASDGDFPDPEAALRADYGVIGWRAGRVLNEALRAPYRRDIPKALVSLRSLDAGTFGEGPVFDETRASAWPVHLFGVSKEHSGLVAVPLPRPALGAEVKQASMQ